jgi:hypothetical protein
LTRCAVLLVVAVLACGEPSATPIVVATPAPSPSAAPSPTLAPALSDAAYVWCTDAGADNSSRVVDAAVRLGLITGVVSDDRDRAFVEVFSRSREQAVTNPDFVRACTAAYDSR